MYAKTLRMLSKLTHRQLVKLRGTVDCEIGYRESMEPIAWECPGCDFSAPSWAEVVNHAQKEHGLESATKGYGISYPPKAVWP